MLGGCMFQNCSLHPQQHLWSGCCAEELFEGKVHASLQGTLPVGQGEAELQPRPRRRKTGAGEEVPRRQESRGEETNPWGRKEETSGIEQEPSRLPLLLDSSGPLNTGVCPGPVWHGRHLEHGPHWWASRGSVQ